MALIRRLLPLLLVSSTLAAQQKTPGVSTKVTTTSGTPPPNAKQAEVQDVRRLKGAPLADPYELERLGLAAIGQGLLPRARKFFEDSWKVGELPTAAYNLACVDLREGRRDDALKHLSMALRAGFDDELTLKNDTDLAKLRGGPEFAGFLELARKNRAEGDAAVVRDALFVVPKAVAGIVVLLHDASSEPFATSGPFTAEAQRRGLVLAVPRGPARVGSKGFGWADAPRGLTAVEAVVEEAKKRARTATVPVYLVGIGRGGVLAYSIAALKAGFAGVASLGGAYDPGQASVNGLRGVRLFMGMPKDAPANVKEAMNRGANALKSKGLSPTFRVWPGSGATLPDDAGAAARDALTGVTGHDGGTTSRFPPTPSGKA